MRSGRGPGWPPRRLFRLEWDTQVLRLQEAIRRGYTSSPKRMKASPHWSDRPFPPTCFVGSDQRSRIATERGPNRRFNTPSSEQVGQEIVGQRCKLNPPKRGGFNALPLTSRNYRFNILAHPVVASCWPLFGRQPAESGPQNVGL